MKHFLLAALILVSSSAQVALANEDWRAPNARPLVAAACKAQMVANQILNSSEPILSCETNTSEAYGSQAFDIADSLSATSFQLLKFRLANRKVLSLETRIQIEDLEIKLDKLVAKFRARGSATSLLE